MIDIRITRTQLQRLITLCQTGVLCKADKDLIAFLEYKLNKYDEEVKREPAILDFDDIPF